MLVTWNGEGWCLRLREALDCFWGVQRQRDREKVIIEKWAGLSSLITIPWANQQEDCASQNWMNHYPNSHHLYSWPNGPIKNIEKRGMITFLKIKIPLHLAWTQPGIYGDYFFASFSKVVFRKVLRIVLCKRRWLKWEFVKIFLFKVVMAQEEWCLGTQTPFLYFT